MPSKTRERRYVSSQFSALENGYVVEGYATTFDSAYEIGSSGIKEIIRMTALDGADMSDVIFRYDHEGMVLARQRNKTLEIEIDEHGLLVRADLGGCEQGRQLYEGIKNGLIDRMSWAFVVDDDGWEYDRESNTTTIRKIRKVYDVAAVGIPANDDTDISARYLDGAIEDIERQEMAHRIELLRKAAKAKFTFETGV